MSLVPLQAPGIAPVQGGRTMGRGLLLSLLAMVVVSGLPQLFTAPDHLSEGYLTGCVVMALFVVVLQFVYRALGPKPVNWLSVEIIFVIMVAMIHFTYPILWLMDLLPSTKKVWINQAVVCQATMASVLGLTTFCIGFHLLPERFHTVRRLRYMNREALAKLKAAGNVMFFAGMALSFVVLVIRPSDAGYYELGGYGGGLVFAMTNMALQIGGLLLTIAGARSEGKWKMGILAKAFTILYIVVALAEGYRSPTGVLVLTLVAAYSEYVKHISFKKIAIGMLVAMMLLGGIRVLRSLRGDAGLGGLRDAASRGQLTWHTGIDNLGWSARMVYLAMDKVPESYDFWYGGMQGNQIFDLLPWLNRIFDPIRPRFTNSSLFFTYLTDPTMGNGAGSTVIADIYVDFGIPGILIEMFALGLLFKHIQQKARATDGLLWNIAHLTLIPAAALMARNHVMFLNRYVIWPVVITYIFAVMLGIPRGPAKGTY